LFHDTDIFDDIDLETLNIDETDILVSTSLLIPTRMERALEKMR